MTRIAVTGAAGYIGMRVVKALHARGVSVVACVHPNDPPERIEKLRQLADVRVQDVLNASNPYAAIGEADGCIHLAWRNGFVHQSQDHLTQVGAHLAFLGALARSPLKTLAVAGTAHEVGFFEGCVRATTPCAPLNPYGVAKNFLRQALLLPDPSITARMLWLRFFYIYGDDRENNSVLSKLLLAAEQGQKSFSLNDGQLLYDFIHVERLAEQISAAVLSQTASGIIHCCAGTPKTLRLVVEEFVRDHGLNIAIEFGKFPLRPYDSRAIWGDATAIEHIMRESTSR